MKTTRLARLFINSPINKIEQLSLSSEDSHYLIHVMRYNVNDECIIFNSNDGEWLCKVVAIQKKTAILLPIEKIRDKDIQSKLWLCFSLIKSPRLKILLEKATELGIDGFFPIITSRTVPDKINIDKIKLWVKEAAEQSERVSLPVINEIMELDKFLNLWNDQILFCNENEKQVKIIDSFNKIDITKPCVIIIGPEGGFAKTEIDKINNHKQVYSVQLGNRILRSDTAAISAISIYQANSGNWDQGPR